MNASSSDRSGWQMTRVEIGTDIRGHGLKLSNTDTKRAPNNTPLLHQILIIISTDAILSSVLEDHHYMKHSKRLSHMIDDVVSL